MQHKGLVIALLFSILFFSSTRSAMTRVKNAKGTQRQIPEDMIAESRPCYIRIDKRLELLSAVQLFTSWRDIGILVGDLPYKQDMLDYFGPFSGHRAVTLCEELIQFSFTYDAPVGFMMHLSDPPKLEVVVPFSEYHIARAGGAEVLEEFVRALRSFCWESNFEEFWDSHRDFYYEIERRALVDVPLESVVETSEDYFGTKQHGYYCFLTPVSSEGYGYRIEVDGSFDVYTFIGPSGTDGDMPIFRGFFHDPYVDCFTFPVVEEFLGEHRNLTRLFEPFEEFPYPFPIPTPYGVLALHVRWAVTAWLFNLYSYVDFYEQRGWIYMRPLYNLLYEYDSRVYGSFREFYPQIVDLFNTIADSHDLTVQVVNEAGESLPQAAVSALLPDGRETGPKLTDNTGRVLFEDLLGITYTIEASSPEYYDQTMKVTLKEREQTKRVTLRSVPFIETLLGKAAIAGGVMAATLVAAFIVLRRRRAQRTLRRPWQPSYKPYR